MGGACLITRYLDVQQLWQRIEGVDELTACPDSTRRLPSPTRPTGGPSDGEIPAE